MEHILHHHQVRVGTDLLAEEGCIFIHGRWVLPCQILEADAETFTFIIWDVSIIISPSIISNFVGILRVIGAYSTSAAQPPPALNAGSDSEDDNEDQAGADDGLIGDEVCQLMLDASTTPYDGSEFIKQLDCTAIFSTPNLIVSHNVNLRKHKTDFGVSMELDLWYE